MARGSGGGRPQIWPSGPSGSGGAPTETPCMSDRPAAQASAPSGAAPTARSRYRPIAMPPRRRGRGGQLPVGDPLQPEGEPHPLGRRRRRTAAPRVPAAQPATRASRRRLHLGDRLEAGKTDNASPPAATNAVEVGVRAGTPRSRPRARGAWPPTPPDNRPACSAASAAKAAAACASAARSRRPPTASAAPPRRCGADRGSAGRMVGRGWRGCGRAGTGRARG